MNKRLAESSCWTTRPYQFGYQYAEISLLVIILNKWNQSVTSDTLLNSLMEWILHSGKADFGRKANKMNGLALRKELKNQISHWVFVESFKQHNKIVFRGIKWTCFRILAVTPDDCVNLVVLFLCFLMKVLFYKAWSWCSFWIRKSFFFY